MRIVISKGLVALTLALCASNVFASELESLAAGSETAFLNPKFAQTESLTAIPAPAMPVKASATQTPWPYFPGTNEGKSPEFNSPIPNFGMVMKGVYRGARMTKEADYAFLRKMGIDTSVNLQYPFIIFKDAPLLCSKYHLNCSYLPVKIIPRTDVIFGMDELKTAYKFTREEIKAGKTVYIHCWYGQERTGLLSAALIINERMCKPGAERDPQLKEKTWLEVDQSLRKYGYREVHQKPFLAMKTWITEFEKNKSWICQ
ncbi:MAG: hypothetical protein NTX59_00570 [Elusimicrobia bacterium]|nr:hypothetical protein [Elusimicrobiota bacterium]